jgi:hypothetical protein
MIVMFDPSSTGTLTLLDREKRLPRVPWPPYLNDSQ